jgi:hypothetical protein
MALPGIQAAFCRIISVLFWVLVQLEVTLVHLCQYLCVLHPTPPFTPPPAPLPLHPQAGMTLQCLGRSACCQTETATSW